MAGSRKRFRIAVRLEIMLMKQPINGFAKLSSNTSSSFGAVITNVTIWKVKDEPDRPMHNRKIIHALDENDRYKPIGLLKV